METYPVDLDASQIVRWVLAGAARGPQRVVTVATMEIEPLHSKEGWKLTIVAEDEAGPRIPTTRTAIGGETEIDLEAFYKDFVASGRGIMNVTAEVEGPAAKARMTRLLESIETDRHARREG